MGYTTLLLLHFSEDKNVLDINTRWGTHFEPTVKDIEFKIKSNASSIVILNLVILGSVIVIFLFSLIWLINLGITEPLLPNTFPYLNAINLVLCFWLSK